LKRKNNKQTNNEIQNNKRSSKQRDSNRITRHIVKLNNPDAELRVHQRQG
jgi:hypothetical protein